MNGHFSNYLFACACGATGGVFLGLFLLTNYATQIFHIIR